MWLSWNIFWRQGDTEDVEVHQDNNMQFVFFGTAHLCHEDNIVYKL